MVGLTLETVFLHVPLVCNSLMLPIFAMQLYWFRLMVRGALKMLKKEVTVKATDDSDKSL